MNVLLAKFYILLHTVASDKNSGPTER